MASLPSLQNLFYPGLRKVFNNLDYSKNYVYPEIIKKTGSDKRSEEFYGITGLGPMANKGVVPNNVEYQNLLAGFPSTITANTFNTGISVHQNDIDDDLYNAFSNIPEMLRQSYELSRDLSVANVYNLASSTAQLGPDQVPLVSAAHTLPGKTVQWSNKLSSYAIPSMAALEALVFMSRTLVDDSGIRINASITKFVIPPEFETIMKRLLTSPDDPSTANRAINTFSRMAPYVVNVRLTSSANWFALTDACSVADAGILLVDRKAVDMTSDIDFDADIIKFKASARWNTGITNPRAVLGVIQA